MNFKRSFVVFAVLVLAVLLGAGNADAQSDSQFSTLNINLDNGETIQWFFDNENNPVFPVEAGELTVSYTRNFRIKMVTDTGESRWYTAEEIDSVENADVVDLTDEAEVSEEFNYSLTANVSDGYLVVNFMSRDDYDPGTLSIESNEDEVLRLFSAYNNPLLTLQPETTLSVSYVSSFGIRQFDNLDWDNRSRYVPASISEGEYSLTARVQGVVVFYLGTTATNNSPATATTGNEVTINNYVFNTSNVNLNVNGMSILESYGGHGCIQNGPNVSGSSTAFVLFSFDDTGLTAVNNCGNAAINFSANSGNHPNVIGNQRVAGACGLDTGCSSIRVFIRINGTVVEGFPQ